MPELTQQERLQPSLLDRLTDDEPSSTQESRNQRIMSVHQLRDGVLRDLAWLLNCSNLEMVEDLEEFPEVLRSVLNYGMPDLTGKTLSSVEVSEVEKVVRQTILQFEPRILSKSVKVRAVVSDSQMNKNAMMFEIEGELWAHPVPLRLFMKTEVDLETGNFTVKEHAGQGQ